MIDIINGYSFKRNMQNVVLYPISELATIIGLQPYQAKEHYFYCVLDDCMSQGELHLEVVENENIELLLPVYNVQALINSLKREGFKIDEFQSKTIIDKMLETQALVSDLFEIKNGFQDYKDPIRKHVELPFIKDLKFSISNKDNDTE